MTLPSMASSSSSSSTSKTSSPLKQTHHLITLRVSPQHEEDLIVSTLYLRDSLFVWCGTTERGRDIEAEIRDQQAAAAEASSSQPSGAVKLDNNGSEPSQDNEAAALASLSEEERRQLEVDRQVDEEIAKAMEAAGRTDDDSPAATTGTPQGYLAREWAMAMHNTRGAGAGGGGGAGAATSLFRSAADVAAPMARRLARRLEVAQVHLSLSLPPDFGANMAAGAGAGSSPLLALEKGIEEAVAAGRGEVAA